MDLLTLIAKLTLDSSEYEKGLTDAEKTAKKSGDALKTGMLKATGVMAAGLTAFAGAAVKTGSEFDASMSQVAATLGKSMDELLQETGSVDTAYGQFTGNLREYAKFMGSNTVFSANQAAEALNYMALAGYDTQKSMEMLPSVLSLAAAGNFDLARASDMVTDASSALHLSQEETVLLVDQMAKTASKTNTSVEQLGDAMLTVGGTANYMKGGTVELNQVLGILADNAFKGSEGGTHLRNMLLKLSAPTKEGAEWIEKLGLHVFDADGKMRAFSEIFPELNESLANLTDEEKMQALSAMFNGRDIAAVNALLGTSAERWAELDTEISNATGSAQQMADTQLDNLSGDITLLKSAFEGFQIELSDKLTPVLRDVVKGLTDFINNMDTWGPIILSVATAFGTLAIALNFSTMLKNLTKGFNTLMTVLSANPLAVWMAVIAGVIVLIKELWDNNEAFREFVIKSWEQIQEAFAVAGENISAFFQAAGEWLDGILQKGAEVWQSIVETVTTAWDTICNAVQVGIMFIAELFNAAIQIITIPFQFIWENCKQIFTDAWNAIVAFLTPILETIRNTISNVWNAITSFISGTMDSISNTISEVWNGISSTVSNVVNAISSTVSSVFGTIKSTVSNIWNSIKSTVSGVVESIRSSISQKFESAKSTVTSIFESIRSKIKEKIDAAKDAVSTAIETIKGFFNFSWSLPPLKLPHFSIIGSFSLNPPSVPHIGLEWYRKAYDSIVEFMNPTVIPTLSGYKGFGDGAGSELVMSKGTFFDSIEKAKGGNVFNATFNIYPSAGMDEEAIAKTVEEYLVDFANQKEAVYA